MNTHHTFGLAAAVAAAATLAATASAVPVFTQTFPAGEGPQEFSQDFFTTNPDADFNPEFFEDGGVVTARVQNLRSDFYSIGGEAFVEVPGLAGAGSLSDVTFSADVALQIFGGDPTGNGTFTFVISSLDADGVPTGTLERVFDGGTSDLANFGDSLDDFELTSGVDFNLAAPLYRLNIRSDAVGIGGFFDSDGANAGIRFDNVTLDVIPEPTTAALGMIAAGGLCLRRRR